MATRSTGASAAHRFPEEIIAEILLRLPGKSVIRFRAVCTVWRRLLTDPKFLAAHSRLRPAEFVLYTRLDDAEPPGNRDAGSGLVDVALDTLPVSSSGDDDGDGTSRRQRLIRYSKSYPRTAGSCLLLSSCNGVLLLKRNEGSYLLCNPATRQWAELPALLDQGHEFAFYFHEPSCEYRLWCRRGWPTFATVNGTWHVLSTGATEPRQVQVHAEPAWRVTDLVVTAPVLLRGRGLHWPPHWVPRSSLSTREEVMRDILVFDTLSETFRIMAGPPTTTTAVISNRKLNNLKLFHMEMEGMLAAAAVGGDMMHINLWFLEDYDAGRWECRHRFAAPWYHRSESLLFRGMMMTGDSEGNVILCDRSSFFRYNVRRKTLSRGCSVDTQENNGTTVVSRHVFRESIVQQPHFSARPSADLWLIHLWC